MTNLIRVELRRFYARRLTRPDALRRRVGRPDLRVHRQLAQSPGDELGVLRAEIEDQDPVAMDVLLHQAGDQVSVR